jgi:hypothetical protein
MGPPPLITEPPLLSPELNQKGTRQLFSIVLSLCVALFLADAIVSFVDDSMILFLGTHALSFLRGLLGIATALMTFGVYGLIGLSPMIPKRLFLPMPVFYLAMMLITFPLTIFWYHQIQLVALGASACQLTLGIGLLYWLCRGRGFSWPLVPVGSFSERRFSWRHLIGFIVANILVVLPLVMIYMFFVTARAVDHFSEGFMALHSSGFTVQVRKYVREDGKVIELFPMAHVANATFYEKVSQTFPTNSVILMEGVTDDQNLLTNKISYKRMAKSLGLAEQKETFAPSRGEMVRADVDIGEFSVDTIDFLNLVMLVHSKGVNAENLSSLMHYAPPPEFEEKLFDDLLGKRNQHLLGEIQTWLKRSDNLMVPWGVAHMPGMAREIQKLGFHLSETHEYEVIRFRGGEKPNKDGGR